MEIYITALIVATVAELIVSGTWQKFYFTAGIPIFRKSARLQAHPELSAELLNQMFTDGWWDPLKFKKISQYEIAFREVLINFAIFRLNYTPLMHGLIRYDPITRDLQVIGFANWFAAFFVVLFIYLTFSFSGPERGIAIAVTLFILGLLGFIYYVQRKRYNSVFKALLREQHTG
jgi:hypothetical protein